MKVKIVYPELSKPKRFFYHTRSVVRVVFLLAALTCLFTNWAVKGKPWSIVVVWSLFSIWNLVFSPDTIEFNMISQIVKLLFFSIVLLGLIDICLVQGWALFVIPIVVFSGLLVTSVFFFIDVNAQSQNSMPLVAMAICSLIAYGVCRHFYPDAGWPMIVMGAVALSLLILCILFNKEFVNELKKRFHTN